MFWFLEAAAAIRLIVVSAAFARAYNAEGGFAPISVDDGVQAVSSWAVKMHTCYVDSDGY